MKKLLPLFLLIILASCAKAPEKTDIEELVGSVVSESCGNGVIEMEEECDFNETKSCSEYDPDMIGPYRCSSCKNDVSKCAVKKTCPLEYCYNNGTCAENDSFRITCKCYANYRGGNCIICEEDFHYDLNGKCIPDSLCTYVGCEYENEDCVVVNGKAVCRCNPPWQGTECDECIDSYYLEDNECKTKYCSIADIECTIYEKCDDSDGKPKCACISETQNPNDCSKCLSGYDMDLDEEDICLNTKYVFCNHDPDAAKGSKDTVIEKAISYTDENGWSAPGYCEWGCPDNTFLENNKCNIIKIYSSEEEDIRFSGPIGVNKGGKLLASYREDIYKLSDRPELIYSADEYLFRPIIGIDNNIYYISNQQIAFFDTTSKLSYKFEDKNSIWNAQQPSILNSGLISAGNYILENFHVNNLSTDITNSSTTISDQNGNILLVESSGLIKFFDSQLNLLWGNTFDDPIVFYLFPVINKEGEAYIPYGTGRLYEFGIMAFDTKTGELLENQIEEKFRTIPLISIDKDNNKYISDFMKFGPDNKLIVEIDNSSPSSNVNPVITNKKIYYANNKNVVCITPEGETVWKYDTNDSIDFLFHHNNRLYSIGNNGYLHIFNAPGELEGDWPQFKQNANFTNSLQKMSFADEPSRTQIISPQENEVIQGDEVNFEWKNDYINAEFLLAEQLTSNSFNTLFGPTTSNSIQIADLANQEIFNWVLVTNNGNGIYSIEKSTFSK